MLFTRAFFLTLLAACALAAPFSALLRGARDVTDDWTTPSWYNFTELETYTTVNYADEACSDYYCHVTNMPREPWEHSIVRIREQEGAEKAVNMYCKAFQDVLSCLQKQAQECDATSGILGTITSTQRLTEYMCSGRGRQLAIQEADCVLPGERFDTATTGCHVDWSGDKCRRLGEMSVCLVNQFRDQCSDDAAEFMSQILYYQLTPEATAEGCELTAP